MESEGNPTAFASRVADARPRVTAVAARLVGRDEAEDVVQEAVLRAFLALSSLRDAARFESWLCGIAINVAKMRLRRAATHARALAAAAPNNTVLQGEERELLELVRDAVDVLPPGQRDVVLLHYVDDLSCDEIAQLLGTSPGAVRVRLHRARAQLRLELAPLAPSPLRKETTGMTEMTLEDVLVHAPDEESRRRPEQAIVLLRERDGERRLPIWIGAPEGAALAFRLHDEAPPRPLTSDLMAELVRTLGGRVEQVAVTRLEENVFYASITVGGRELDARPSDAINLAVRTGAPILVEPRVLEQAALPPDGLEQELEEKTRELGLEQGRWTSLSTELLRPLFTWPRK